MGALTNTFSGVVLRGSNEFLQADFGGNALPSGTAIAWEVSWTESDA